MLPGASTQLAAAAIVATDIGPVAQADIVNGYLLTRLLVGIKDDATVGQVNAAAAAVGATSIAFAAPPELLVTLQVPRQASVADLRRLADQLQAQPGIRFAFPSRELETSDLPTVPGIPSNPQWVSWLLPARFPAAWNARGAGPADCRPYSVPVYVADRFGDPHSRPYFSIDPADYFEDEIEVGTFDGHGFDVMQVIGSVLGANRFPHCTSLREIETIGRDEWEALNRIMNRISLAPGPSILNLSQNFGASFCGPSGQEPCNGTMVQNTPRPAFHSEMWRRVTLAKAWADFMRRNPGVEQRILMTQSAGNIETDAENNYRGLRYASFASPPALAFEADPALVSGTFGDPGDWGGAPPLFPDMTMTQAEIQDGLTRHLSGPAAFSPLNLLVVEGTNNRELAADLILFSSAVAVDFNVSAVAEQVEITDVKNGTSFSAAQVAGLASYLWLLDDNLRHRPVQETVDLIRATTRRSDAFADLNFIDAYAAVLALDARNHDKRIRKAIVDVNGDGAFDHLDLQKFRDAYDLTNPNRPTIPASRDYSRFDLNGDGATGGIMIDAFDLDAGPLDSQGKPVLNTVNETIETYPIAFNEAALSDVQILCALAYSSLYDGGTQANAERTAILGMNNCVEPRMSAVLPSPISGSGTVSILVERSAGAGQYAPAPNLQVELVATGGTVLPTNTTTNASGVAIATVTPAQGASLVSVTAIARATPGGTVLVQKTVTASVANAGPTKSVRGYYDGTMTETRCAGGCVTTRTERWLLGYGSTLNSGTLRRSDLIGSCYVVGLERCTPEFPLTDVVGSSFSETSANHNTITGSAGAGQLNFTYTYCSTPTPPTSVCDRFSFSGILPMEYTPAALDFGPVVHGGSSTLAVTIRNNGPLPVGVYAEIQRATPYTADLAALGACEGTDGIPPHSSCVMNVTFAPPNTGNYEYDLDLSDAVTRYEGQFPGQQTSTLVIPLRGTGT